MVFLATKLKKEHGILPNPPMLSLGRKISGEEKLRVASFFERDDISRQCPGKKDFLSVKDQDGVRHQKQKRLVLGNLKEIFQIFKEEEGNPSIGFSSFCSFRPQHCVLAGSGGTHSVCVCTYHQNPTLQLNAIGQVGLQLEHVISKAVCSVDSANCMLRKCSQCPGKEAVLEFVGSLPELEGKEEIRYKKWVSVDRCTLEDVVEPVEQFIESFSSAIIQLLRHHFVAKSQGKAFKEKKEMLSQNEGVLVGDFAENYSFLVQDAAQGYHWDNSQCTLHPFVFYFKDADSNLQHESFCFISDGTKHTTPMVFTFLKKLIPLLRSKYPNLLRILYLTDGSAAQYKNRFNFINLTYHEEDLSIPAEWNFFAIFHGINACDGIGGTLKRYVSKASLQCLSRDQILTAVDFFNYCTQHISSIKCLFTKKEEVDSTAAELETRFAEAITIQGTQKHHHFKPLNNGFIEIAELSDTSCSRAKVKIRKTAAAENYPSHTDERNERDLDYVNNYVVVEERSKKWVAFVDHQDKEFGDYHVKFLQPYGIRKSYAFAHDQREQCYKTQDQIMGLLPEPVLSAGTRIRYSFPKERLETLMK